MLETTRNMEQEKLIMRLKRSEGQLRGIQKMLEEERECMDIIVQLTAVRSSINSIMELVITKHLYTCLDDPLDDPKKQRKRIEKVIKYLVREHDK